MKNRIFKYCYISIFLVLTSCSSIQQNTTNISEDKTSIVYQVTSEAPFIDNDSISQLSNRNVGNIQGISDYLSSAFLKRHQDKNSENGYLTAYKISYSTVVPNTFGTYIRCNHDENGKYECNPKDTYVCKKQICEGSKNYKECMENKCSAIGDSSQIGAAWINSDLTNPVMFFSLPQASECSTNQQLGDNNCSWKVYAKLGSVTIKSILDAGLLLKPEMKETSDERQIRIDKNTEILEKALEKM